MVHFPFHWFFCVLLFHLLAALADWHAEKQSYIVHTLQRYPHYTCASQRDPQSLVLPQQSPVFSAVTLTKAKLNYITVYMGEGRK